MAASLNHIAAAPSQPSLKDSAGHLSFHQSFRQNLRLPSRTCPPASVTRAKISTPRAEVRQEKKLRVELGPYRDGAIKATAKRPQVKDEDIEKALQAKLSKTHEFERINFTGSGAKLGHTVRLNFEGKYAEGPNAGQPVKGTKAQGYELTLEEREDEPWRTFVREVIKAGMGQEESKSFPLTFPPDYKAKPLAGVKALFTITVKEIGVKKELPKDPRPVEEQREEVAAQLRAAAERVSNEVVDAQIRAALLESSFADVEKAVRGENGGSVMITMVANSADMVAASVTWAKFGERSLQDFKWNVLQEEVGRLEGISFDQVPAYLRSQASITYTD